MVKYTRKILLVKMIIPRYISVLMVFGFWSSLTVQAQSYDFSNVPGVVIAHRPSSDKVFLGSPGICILPNGTYLASHDFFGSEKELISVYESKDKGTSWKKISELKGFWSGVFLHNANFITFHRINKFREFEKTKLP